MAQKVEITNYLGFNNTDQKTLTVAGGGGIIA